MTPMEAFIYALPRAGLGWLGIFVVTAVIVAVVMLLDHFSSHQ